MFNLPKAGFGTTQFWYGTDREAFLTMLAAVSEGGIRMIDTAEMYGDGRCEEAVGGLIRTAGRDSLYIVDKILPEHANARDFFPSLEKSLSLLGTDCIDLYLLHWREDADLAEMSSLMEDAKAAGKIREWGVSNFDTHDMEDLMQVRYGDRCRVNQIFYNPLHRGIEYDLMPYMKEKNISLMSYSSLDTRTARRALLEKEEIVQILREENVTLEALMLAFNLHHGVCPLFQTKSVSHLRDNLKGLDLDIGRHLQAIDRACPPPSSKVPMEKR